MPVQRPSGVMPISRNTNFQKNFDKDSPLRKLIRIFRSGNVVKHHFQSAGPKKATPQGTAKAFFRNSYSFQSSVIPGYSAYDRFARYSDYAEMESYPTLHQALNIFADEVTQKNEKGKIVEVISENTEIQKLLQELFDVVLNLNGKSLYKMVRNLLKYGDAFYLIDVTPENGVVNLLQMPANEVEREEGFDKDEPGAIRFRWTTMNNAEIPNAYVLHYRLDGNDLFYPYGQCLKYDTKILVKNGIKEIKDIKKGDFVLSFNPEEQRQEFSKVLDIINSGKKECYKIKTRHNFLESSKEHKVLVYTDEGFRYVFAEELQIGDRVVISKEHKTDNCLPKIDKTKPIENKNGWWNSIVNIPDFIDEDFARFFGFMLGDGWIRNNKVHLAWGINDEINDFYQQLLEKYSGKIGSYNLRDSGSISDVGVNSKMLSTILERLGFAGNVYSKRIPDWVFSAPKNIREAVLDGMQDADGSEFTDKWCTRYQIELANEKLIKDFKCLVQSLGYKSSNISSRNRGFGDLINGVEVKSRKDCFYFYYYKSINEQFKSQDLKNRKTNEFILEPIISIEKSDLSDVYDIHVDNKYHNFYANGIVVHNSILEGARRPWRQLVLLEDAMMVYRITRAPERRVFFLDIMGAAPDDVEQIVNKFNQSIKKHKVTNDKGQIDLRYAATLSMEEDYVIPVRGGDSATRIETLPGGQNIGDIEDIEFVKKNLFIALGIPKAFLTEDEAIGSKQTLTQEDIRFARTVARVQEVVIGELVKLSMIHLYIKGYRGSELVNFRVKMTNPSTVAELQKNELWRARMDLVHSAGDGVFDTEFIYKNFLHLGDDTIDKVRKGQILDKLFQAKLMQIENQGGAMPMDMGMGGLGGGMGGFGGGMGMGGDMGMGLPSPGLGGDTGMMEPGMGGTPQLGTMPAGGMGEAKDLTRTSDRRFATDRGVDQVPGVSQNEREDDPSDIAGINRTYKRPLGAKETLEYFQDVLDEYKKNAYTIKRDIITEIVCRENGIFIGEIAASNAAIDEKFLSEAFGGSNNNSSTQSILKEAARETLEEQAELENWGDEELKRLDDKCDELFMKVYRKD